MGENRTFHPQTALLASGASKTPKKQQEITLFARGAAGGPLGALLALFTKRGEKGEFSPKWAILPNFGVLGHFRDFRDSGLPEMQAPGGPASPIWEPPDFPR